MDCLFYLERSHDGVYFLSIITEWCTIYLEGSLETSHSHSGKYGLAICPSATSVHHNINRAKYSIFTIDRVVHC